MGDTRPSSQERRVPSIATVGLPAGPGGPGARRSEPLAGIVEHQDPVERLAGVGRRERARSPVLAKVPVAVAAPVRGLNHHAFTFGPVIAAMRTVNGRPAGA